MPTRLPVLHSVQLANAQVHSPAMGPHWMLELGDDGLAGDAAAAAFTGAIHEQLPVLAERHLRSVLRDRGPAGTLALILEAALPRQAIDDHFLLYPVFAAQTLDLIGWQWAEFVLRPVVRWLASPPLSVMHGDDDAFFMGNLAVYHRFGEVEALVDGHRLLEKPPPEAYTPAEDNLVADLAGRIGGCEDFSRIAPTLAEALAGGLSMQGALHALSLGAATLQLRSDYGNPLDVHMQNGISVRRYLLSLQGLPLRTRLVALLSWATGPEVLLTQSKLGPDMPLATAGLPRDADALLAALAEAIEQRPPVPAAVHSGGGRAGMRAGEGVRPVMSLAQAYLDQGHDPARLASLLAGIVARDSFTEMHAFEHADDTAREAALLPSPQAGRHLVTSAKIAWCGYGIDQSVYEQAEPLLAAAG